MKRLQTIIMCSTAIALTVLSHSGFASENGQGDETKELDFLFVPVASAKPGSKVVIKGVPSQILQVERMVLAYRNAGEKDWLETNFKRSVKKSAVAVIPAEVVESPGVDYFVYIAQPKDGAGEKYLFASRKDPHRILVHGYSKRTRYEKRKAEWNGRLSRIEANYGYTLFGKNLVVNDNGTESTTKRGNYYHGVNLAYTYRFLTALYALRVEIGGFAHDFRDFRPFTAAGTDEIGPGMYDISPSVDFEFHKFVGASILMRLGISEDGFEGGAGTSVRIGRINGTRLDLGFEGMSHAGWRMFLRFEWDTIPHVPMSFNIDRTQWYAASSYAEQGWGNRLYYEAKFLLPVGIGLRAHAGFASRDEVVKSGFVAGAGAWIDF